MVLFDRPRVVLHRKAMARRANVCSRRRTQCRAPSLRRSSASTFVLVSSPRRTPKRQLALQLIRSACRRRALLPALRSQPGRLPGARQPRRVRQLTDRRQRRDFRPAATLQSVLRLRPVLKCLCNCQAREQATRPRQPGRQPAPQAARRPIVRPRFQRRTAALPISR